MSKQQKANDNPTIAENRQARFEYFYLQADARLFGDLLSPRRGELKLPHHICEACGHYNGREVIPQTSESAAP